MFDTFAAYRRLMLLICLSFVINANTATAKQPQPGVPVQGQDDPVPAYSEETRIPRDALLSMYQTELKSRFHEEDADKILQAHQTLENYFDAPSASLRKQTVIALNQSKLDPAILGKLCRLRMRWPALETGVYYVNEKRGPYDVRYYLGVPAGYDRTKPWPLVVKLGPIGPFVTQPPPDAAQVQKLYHGWIKDELSKHPDALVLMPLLNPQDLYGPSYTGMNSVIQPMLHAAERVNVDNTRVYLIGFSTGGHAVWNLAMHYPTYFASIAPLAGGAGQDWQRLRLPNLRNVPPVVWADAKDKIVRPGATRGIVDALKNLKIRVDYVETKTFGHDLPASVVEERYQTMRTNTRQLYPSWVTIQSNRPDVQFNRNDWLQIWQETDPGKESRLLFRGGATHMTITENSAKIDGRREANSFELTLDNVDSLRLYLNEQMVDLDKPLTFTINKKRTIQGKAKPNLDEMLIDQIFIGRGWRYYTAVLDIDLSDPAAATRPSTQATTRPSTRPTTKSGKIIVGPGATEGTP